MVDGEPAESICLKIGNGKDAFLASRAQPLPKRVRRRWEGGIGTQGARKIKAGRGKTKGEMQHKDVKIKPERGKNMGERQHGKVKINVG